MSFGQTLIKLREEKHISRKDLASEFDIPYTTLRNYENDTREPGHRFLIQVAKYFKVSTDYLLGIENKDASTIMLKNGAVNKNADIKIRILVDALKQLNEEGQNKLLDYAADLIAGGRYQSEDCAVKLV